MKGVPARSVSYKELSEVLQHYLQLVGCGNPFLWGIPWRATRVTRGAAFECLACKDDVLWGTKTCIMLDSRCSYLLHAGPGCLQHLAMPGTQHR